MKQLDPARHVAPMTADTIIADQQLEIAGLKEQLRLEKAAHEKTQAALLDERSKGAWQATAEWLRIRGQEPDAPNQKLVTDMAVSGRPAAMWEQLCADAMHSGLIRRLHAGKRPLPPDEYRAAKASGNL
jgi:hypothetical protein